MLTSPALVWLAGRAGIGRLQVTLGEERDADETPHVVSETQDRPVDVPQEPQVLGREAVREHLANVPDAAGEFRPPVRTKMLLVGQRHFGLKTSRFAAYPVFVSGTA